jgi:hypothetical protein
MQTTREKERVIMRGDGLVRKGEREGRQNSGRDERESALNEKFNEERKEGGY